MKQRKFGRYLLVWLCISFILFGLLYAFVIRVDSLGYESTILKNFYVKMSNPDVYFDGQRLNEYGILANSPKNIEILDRMVDPDEKVLDYFIYNKFDKFLIKATRDLALFRTDNLSVMNDDNICIFDYDLYYLNGGLDRVQKHGAYISIYSEEPWDESFVLNGKFSGFSLEHSYMTTDEKRISYDFVEAKKDMLFPDDLSEEGSLDGKTKEYDTELLYKDRSVPYQIIFECPKKDDEDETENILSDDLLTDCSTSLFRSDDYLISFCRSDYGDLGVVKVILARTIPYFEAESSYCLFTAASFFSVALLVGILFAVIRYRRYKHVYDLITYRNNLTDNLAHNFKTPLQIISGYAENIGDTDSPEDLKRYSEAITDKVARMNESIETILLASKRVENKAVKNDVREIVDEISAGLDNMSRVKLVVEGSAVIKCDRLILTNILTNLLDNASRYAPEGGEVKVLLKGRHVTVTNPVKNEMFVPGIGLTVATRMAENIRMTLTIKNDGKFFTAVLK